MKIILINAETGEEHEVESLDEAQAYISEQGKRFAAEQGVPESEVEAHLSDKPFLSDYDRGVTDTLLATAHAFKKSGTDIAGTQTHPLAEFYRNSRQTDFEFLHGLADAVKSGTSTGHDVTHMLYKAGHA